MKKNALLLAVLLVIFGLAFLVAEWAGSARPGLAWRLGRMGLVLPKVLADRVMGELIQAGPEGLPAAKDKLKQVVALEPANARHWCDLGQTLLELGQTEQARYCFQQAQLTGPKIPRNLLRIANFHFRVGEEVEAARNLAAILKSTSDYDAVVFSLFVRMEMALHTILQDGLPNDLRAGQAFTRFFLPRATLLEGQATWGWIRARHFDDDALAGQYVDFLLRQKAYEQARSAWLERLGRNDDVRLANLLFNGSFEEEFRSCRLDWNVSPVPGVAVERNTAAASDGRFSLKITFPGTTNLEYRQISQLVVVSPGSCRLTARLRSDNLTTDRGVAIQIFDQENPGRLNARTPEISGTQPWTTVDVRFAVPSETHLLAIQIVRQESLKFDCKIAGTVWVDDVQLIKE